MKTDKQEVEQLVRRLPNDCTIEDAQYHLYVLAAIRRGYDDIKKGRVLSHEEVKTRVMRKVRTWLDTK